MDQEWKINVSINVKDFSGKAADNSGTYKTFNYISWGF